MNIEIFQYEEVSKELAQAIDEWSCGLWWSDFEEAQITSCYIAFDGDEPVGFQTVNNDNRCVAIEVKSDYQNKGIALLLIGESFCIRPDRNENEEFWAKIAEKLED